ncbi:MAG: sugar transferase [Armatimonadota bacterium]|nr:sugar transferase [Armatimonadota bacterium]
MSVGDLPDNPDEICLICMNAMGEDNSVAGDVAALLRECQSIEERAAYCHDLRELLCPFSDIEDICKTNARGRFYSVAKRAVDLLGGLIGSVVVAVLLPLVAVAIKLQSPGPVFFTQKRIGLHGKPFSMVKFRTMHEKTSDEARWANEEEERIFTFGSFMRRFHIDEFPQFFSVLVGHMSLVGPRPEQVPIVERLRMKIPHYDARHCVPPGITGWAQVRHGYAGCELSSWVKTASDLYYVARRSLWLDMSILFRTLLAVLVEEGRQDTEDGRTRESSVALEGHSGDTGAQAPGQEL